MTGERLKKVIETVARLQEFERRMCQLEVDETEYAYMKFLALFCPGEIRLFLLQKYLSKELLMFGKCTVNPFQFSSNSFTQ